MLLYDRKCVLYVYAGDEKYEIDELDMDFRIELTIEPEPNSAEITIYGLQPLTRLLFSEAHQAIEFHAGYGDDTAMIFSGVTANVVHSKTSVDWMTTIYAYDGLDALVDPQNKFNKAYSKGVSVGRIVEDVAEHLGIPYFIAEETTSDSDVTPYGVVYSGVPKKILTQLMWDFDLEWHIQLGTLYVYGSRTLLDPSTVLLTPETGMIGSPAISERTEQLPKRRKKKAKPKRIPYVEVTSLLNHKVLPGKLIEIQSNRTDVRTGKPTTEKAERTDANGEFYVTSVTFQGDNYEGEFYVTAFADAGEDIFYYKTPTARKASRV